MIIKASATLRNEYSTISTLAHETKEPIYITKNGEGDLVNLLAEKLGCSSNHQSADKNSDDHKSEVIHPSYTHTAEPRIDLHIQHLHHS